MFYRSSVILARWTWGSGAQVKPIEINLTQPISRITVNAELVNNGYAPTDHPAKAIKGITVCDGGDILFSMDGGACQALSFYGTGKQPYSLPNYIDNDSSRFCYPIDFGRFLYDKLYALDPSRFDNLEIKLDIDRSLGSCTPDGGYLTVTADIFDEKVPSLVGFLMSSEVKSYFPTDDLTEPINLPRDFPYRLVLIKACAEEEGAIVQCEDFKLTEDHDKHIIIDERTEQYMERVSSQYPYWIEPVNLRPVAGGRNFYVTCTHGVALGMVKQAYTDSYGSVSWQGGQLQTMKANLGDDWIGVVYGQAPYGGIPILFGDKDDPEDFWNPSGLKSLLLNLHTRSTDACDQTDTRTKVIVQQVKPY